MARILIVEDERDMAKGLKDNFEFDGHEALMAHDGEAGLRMIQSENPELIILDIMLPKRSGLDVCRTLREQGCRIPIIMLTARGQEMDKVLGLELGADDYITKPFSLRELLARVRAVLRRYSEKPHQTRGRKTIGRLYVDFDCFVATDDEGVNVRMTHKEFLILRYLLDHAGEIVTRDALLDCVWGLEAYPSTRTVDNQILKLRKKVEADPANPAHILTAHGIGYKLIP